MHTFKTRFMTADMLEYTGVAVPRQFTFAKGARIDITLSNGNHGTLAMTSPTRARWTSNGSAYNGRDFDVTPRFRSEGRLEVALLKLAA